MEIEIKLLLFNSVFQKKSIELRRKILRLPLGLDFTVDELENENDQIHVAAIHNNEIVGILLLKIIDKKTLKMRQVAVNNKLQNIGIGKKIVIFSENYAKEKGFSKIELNARISAVQFYKKLNYKIEGDIFNEVGIEHIKMTKIIE